MGIFSKLFTWVTGSRPEEAAPPSAVHTPTSAAPPQPVEPAPEPFAADEAPSAAEHVIVPQPDTGIAPQAVPEPEPEPYPEALTQAAVALQAGRFRDAQHLAADYVNAGDARIRADANRFCALAGTQLGLWPQVFARWHEVFKLESTADHAARLAAAAAMCGDVEHGESWLSLAEKINAETREFPAPALKWEFVGVLYRQGLYAPAVRHLDWFKGVYERLSITESAFLQTRGMPEFADFLERSYAVLNRIWSTDEIRVWYRSMQSQLDGDGRQKLQDVFKRLA